MEILALLKDHYNAQKDWEMIIELDKKALEVLKLTNNFKKIANSYYEIGVAFSRLEKHRKAIQHYKSGVNCAIRAENNHLIYIGLVSVGESYFHLRDIENARAEYFKALSLATFMGDADEINKTKMVLLALGASKEEIQEALERGKKEITKS
jgi:tetratricopeptide (TPR) repeat protein